MRLLRRQPQRRNPQRLVYSTILYGLEPSAATAFELVLDPGAYTLTGAEAGLETSAAVFDRVVAASANRQPAERQAGARIVGPLATQPFAYELNLAAGAYSISGAAAGTVQGFSLNVAAGAYTLTGTADGLVSARMVNAVAGSYALTGFEAELLFTPTAGEFELALDAGAYTLTGAASALPAARLFNAAAGAYALTGVQAGTVAGRAVSVAAGSYALTGAQAGLTSARATNLAAGTYTLTGADAELSFSGEIIPTRHFGKPSPNGQNGFGAALPQAAQYGKPTPGRVTVG